MTSEPREFEEFMRELTRHQRRLRGLVHCLLFDRRDVEDVWQDMNVTLLRKAGEFQAGTDFWAWACAVTRYQVLTHCRRLGRERLVFDEELLRVLAEEVEQRGVSIDQRREALQECLEKLPGPQRQLLEMRYGPDDAERVEGRMMYDAEHLYLAAHVGDPAPLRNVIDPAMDADAAWRGGGLQVRLSTDRAMGWPVQANAPNYYAMRRLEPSAEERAAALDPRLSHLTMWYHAPSKTACLTIAFGMLVRPLVVNPEGFRGAFTRDADGKGYVLEYAIPWRLLNAADPPLSGDILAAAWQVHWSDTSGRWWRDQLVEIRNRQEPHRILVWERAATWGRAEYK